MRSAAADGLDLLAEDVRNESAWHARVERDRRWMRGALSRELLHAVDLLLARSVAAGAEAVALTGSSARGRRTATSDLDLLVVGERPALEDVDVEIDVYATTPKLLLARLRKGDDYVQWTLRFGCVLFDGGVLRAAADETVASAIWPSAERKLVQVGRMVRVAEQVVASGDAEAAGEQVRGVVTALARWRLLHAGAFPLSRAELPDQLRAVGEYETADALEHCIHGSPTIDELQVYVAAARDACAGIPGAPVG